MPRAIIINGPSGVGKSTLAARLSKARGYLHADADAFKRMYSAKRSKARTQIGERLAYTYASDLISRNMDLIIEAIPEGPLRSLKRKMKKKRYRILEICLKAPVDQCIRNDKSRGAYGYGGKVIREVYPALSRKRGLIIDATGKSRQEVFIEAVKILDEMGM